MASKFQEYIAAGNDAIGCTIKAAIFRTEEAAAAEARLRGAQMGIGSDGLRPYQCFRCKYWHLTKAKRYKAWINSPRGWRKWNIVEEAELGTRAYSCGLAESTGSTQARLNAIHKAGAAALKRRLQQELHGD